MRGVTTIRMLPTRPRRSPIKRTAAPPLALTERDVDLLRDLLLLRFASSPALALLRACSNTAARWKARARALYDAQLLSRFQLGRSVYLDGKDYLVYTLETGVASAVAVTRKGRWAHTDADWARYTDETSDAREHLVQLLTQRGLASDRVRSILEKNTDIALKIVCNESSQVHHLTLAATFVALTVAAARAHGLPIDAWLPDGMADLSFSVTPKPGAKPVIVPCKPDALLVIDGHAIALEAETGHSSRAKIAEKIARYGQLTAQRSLAIVAEQTGCTVVKSLRVVFSCATEQHATMITEEIRKAFPKGTGFFLVVDSTDLHLHYTMAELEAGRTATIPALFPYLRSLVTTPVFSQVEGTDTVTVERTKLPIPKLGYVPLLTVPATTP